MKNLLLIFTMALATSACGAEFNPDLSSMGETGSGTSGDGSDSDDTGSDTGADTGSSGTPDMGGDGDTDSTDETGDTEDTGDGAMCGDGVAEENEDCDGADMLGASCEDGDFYGGGSVTCTGTCTLDYSGCNELLYEQKFWNGAMPGEVQLSGDINPFLQHSEDLYGFMGQWNGSCFDGEDDHCMQFGAITHNQTSTFTISLDFVAAGEVRFWYFGWTEQFDKLEFRIDNQPMQSNGGQVLAPVEWVHQVDTPGVHELKWTFSKDNSITDGFDTVCVDSITVTNAELL